MKSMQTVTVSDPIIQRTFNGIDTHVSNKIWYTVKFKSGRTNTYYETFEHMLKYPDIFSHMYKNVFNYYGIPQHLTLKEQLSYYYLLGETDD